MKKPIVIKPNEEFVLHKSIYTYEVVDSNIKLTRTGEYKGKASDFTPPALQEVKDFFKSKGYSEEGATKAYDYYTEMNWIDNNKKPVKSWKGKMIAIWLKAEYKIKEKTSSTTVENFFQREQ